MASSENPTIGVLASPEWVRIRISARAASREEADRLIDRVDAQVRERLPGLVMGVDAATLEGAIDALLRERDWTLAVGETFTGGLIAQRLTAAAASCFVGGLTTALTRLDDANPRQAAPTFAEKARTHYGADCGLGTVADPSRQVVYGAFVCPRGTAEWDVGYAALDARMQLRVGVACLERVRRFLTKPDPLDNPGTTEGPGAPRP